MQPTVYSSTNGADTSFAVSSLRRTSRLALFAALATVAALIVFVFPPSAVAQQTPNAPASLPGMDGLLDGGPEAWTSPDRLSSTIQIMLLLTVLSIAPAILLMTTCFVRIIVVLGLLRQAMGTQQLPPNQVITAITLFLTFLIMMPVWERVKTDAVVPYTEGRISFDEARQRGLRPIREFMTNQIERTGNSDDVWLFLDYLPRPEPPDGRLPTGYSEIEDVPLEMLYADYDDVPLSALLPAFMVSELKTAFLIGFQIYLPFLILDLVIASVTISMGMLMLPPVLISLPFKLLLFVLVDGWHLVVGMLLESFQPYL